MQIIVNITKVKAILWTIIRWTIVYSMINPQHGKRSRNSGAQCQAWHLSQEELAAQANIDRTYISGIERETRNPTITIVAKIAEVLGTTAGALLTNQSKTTEF
jgi:DNA-binding XRE family transcriptional regulator